jgi:hypothetical protein
LIGLVAQGFIRFVVGFNDLRHEEEAVCEVADFSRAKS